MDPVTIGIGLTLLVGAWAAFRRKSTQQSVGACGNAASTAAAEAVAGQAVGGATAGSSVPGIGTAAGAGIGAGLALVQISQTPCGRAWLKHGAQQIAHLSADACAHADQVLATLKSKGIATPLGWDHMSCDQKLAAVAAIATPLGLMAWGADEAVSTGLAAANTTENNVEAAASNVGRGASNVANKIKKVF